MILRSLGLLICLLGMAPALAECRYALNIVSLGYASFVDQQGQIRGFYPDLYRELARRSACELVMEALPAERARALGQIRPAPLSGPAGKPAPEAMASRVFVQLSREPMDMLLRADAGVSDMTRALQRKGLVFGVIRGVTYGPQVDALLASLPADRIDYSVDAQTVYRKLEAGRIAATFGNAYVYRWYFDQSPASTPIRVLAVPGSESVPVGILLDKRGMTPHHLTRFRREVEAIRDTGLFEQMMARYLGAEIARARQYRPGKAR